MPGKSKQKDFKDEVIKEVKEEGKKGATKVEKMDIDTKKEKKDAAKTQKSLRPSSTPPTETGKGIGMGQIAGCLINGNNGIE